MVKFKEMASGETYRTFALISEVNERESRNGAKYLDVKLSDGETSITAKCFDFNAQTFQFYPGDMLKVELNVSTYNSGLSYIMKRFRGVTEEDKVNKYDLIKTAPVPMEDMYNECLEVIDEISKRDEIGYIAQEIYGAYKQEILTWSAAKSMHHNYCGGLLYHSWRMMKAAQELIKLYPDVDGDMVIIGCLLHDIGKLQELDSKDFGGAEYTTEGSLLGHLLLGVEMVNATANTVGVCGKAVTDLTHIIASHHYNREWGAITPPHTMEAFLVSQLDNIDAKMEMFENAEQGLAPDTFTDKPVLDGIKVYKSSRKNNEK